MLDAALATQKLLTSMEESDKQHLLNALLGLDTCHHLNSGTSFYSYRNIRKLLHPKRSEAMQSFHFSNNANDQLIIRQLKDFSFFKNSYRIEILFNGESYDYHLIDQLLQQLHENCYADVYSYA